MTKQNAILMHLEEIGYITSLEAIQLYRATRLSAIIYNLRHKHGMNIENEWVEFTDRFGSKSRYVKYIYKKEEEQND